MSWIAPLVYLNNLISLSVPTTTIKVWSEEMGNSPSFQVTGAGNFFCHQQLLKINEYASF